MVLAAIVCRANLEMDKDDQVRENEELAPPLLPWLRELRLKSELEPEELRFLETPVGSASQHETANKFFLAEGVAVLAWALRRYELPPYDQLAHPNDPLEGVGFLRTADEGDLRRSAVLRPDPEIGRFSSHITIVNWRLRQFQAGQDSALYRDATGLFGRGRSGVGEPMDFVGLLRSYFNFRERWLEDLRLIDGDLAIGDKSISEAAPAEVRLCGCIATARQVAAYWLEGDNPIYSKVNPSTLLSACVE
jgi:hypothetical protein